mmetsp:Transcript_9031/g.26578  ORF Transcript_9031/g.26578 Transcript_9031/m.26578 type:complete len:206 (+) Transcript_9031:2179-2796(+)
MHLWKRSPKLGMTLRRCASSRMPSVPPSRATAKTPRTCHSRHRFRPHPILWPRLPQHSPEWRSCRRPKTPLPGGRRRWQSSTLQTMSSAERLPKPTRRAPPVSRRRRLRSWPRASPRMCSPLRTSRCICSVRHGQLLRPSPPAVSLCFVAPPTRWLPPTRPSYWVPERSRSRASAPTTPLPSPKRAHRLPPWHPGDPIGSKRTRL